MYDDFFDTNNDGHLDAGEMSNYMDFVDYMNHDGIYKDSSDYDNYDVDGTEYDGLDGEQDEDSFYSGSYGGSYLGSHTSGQSRNISSMSLDQKNIPSQEELLKRQEEWLKKQESYYRGEGNKHLKSSAVYAVVSGALLAYCIWISRFTYYRGFFYDFTAIFWIVSTILNVCFWVNLWKGIFYKIYKKGSEAYLYIATPISTLSVAAYFVILIFVIAD